MGILSREKTNQEVVNSALGKPASLIPMRPHGAHEYYLRTFQGVSAGSEQQTAEMAEGPDPSGQTLVKCEFSVSSGF